MGSATIFCIDCFLSINIVQKKWWLTPFLKYLDLCLINSKFVLHKVRVPYYNDN